MRLFATSLLLVALGAVNAQPEVKGTPMAVEEHFRLAAGNTQISFDPWGFRVAVYLMPDGKQRLRTFFRDGSIKFEDEGQLTIENGMYCRQMKKLNDGLKVCAIKVLREGDAFRFLRPDGSSSVHTFEPGNSRGL